MRHFRKGKCGGEAKLLVGLMVGCQNFPLVREILCALIVRNGRECRENPSNLNGKWVNEGKGAEWLSGRYAVQMRDRGQKRAT